MDNAKHPVSENPSAVVAEVHTRRMLIVDGVRTDRAYIGRLVENSGVQTDWAAGGIQALALLPRGYDLVMTSLSTADMNGLELLLRIKQVDANVEVIVTGTDRTEETVSRVMRRGAFCYFPKPFSDNDTDRDAMIRAVRRALERRRETEREEALYRAVMKGEISIVDADGGPHEIPFGRTGVPATDLLSMMNDGFVFLDAAGRISFANVKFSRKLNRPYRSILNKEFVTYVLREDRASFAAFTARVRESRIGIHETRIVNRTGRIMNMLVTCRRLDAGTVDDQSLLVLTDITARKRSEQELLQANEQLITMNKELTEMNKELIAVREAQRNFFAAMSHELKTPLNAIGGYAGLMLDGIGGALGEKHRKWMESVKRQSNRLLRMIQEILEFAKLDKREEALALQPVKPDALVQETASAAWALVGRKPVSVTTEIAPNTEPMHSDPFRLRQVLTNLASNAVKFTQSGRVCIGTQPLPPDKTAFFVEDTGIGIAPSEQQKIFSDFYQINGNVAYEVSGNGLGLAIVRRHVERLGGTVQVSSQPGKGSRFTVVIPTKPREASTEKTPP